MKPGPKCLRLSRLSRAQVEAGQAAPIECTFPNPKAKSIKRQKSTKGTKAKTQLVEISDQEDDGDDVDEDDVQEPGDIEDSAQLKPWDRPISGDGDDDDDDDDGGTDPDCDFSSDEWKVIKGRAGGWRPDGAAQKAKS